jgi:DNA-3-methyladenine glycosylase II
VPEIKFRLKPIAPFRLDLTAWAIRRRPHNTIDLFDGETYRRVLVIDGKPAAVSVRQIAPPNRPEIELTARGQGASATTKSAIVAAVGRILGLEIDLRDFYRLARDDAKLGPLANRLMGMKPVRFPTNFEAFTNAVACQLVSLTAGLHVVNRISQKYGLAYEADGIEMHACAEAQDIACAEVEDLRGLGLSRNKARYLIGLAHLAATSESRDFGAIESLDDAAAAAALSEYAGVGRWTAEYVMLRGFGRLNFFPGGDVGGRNGLREWLGIRRELDFDAVDKLIRRWHPYGGFIYFHLIVNALVERGIARA